MKTRTDNIDRMIVQQDIAGLLNVIEFPWCGCLGKQDEDDSQLCPCRLRQKYAKDRVSYAALKLGRFLALK